MNQRNKWILCGLGLVAATGFAVSRFVDMSKSAGNAAPPADGGTEIQQLEQSHQSEAGAAGVRPEPNVAGERPPRLAERALGSVAFAHVNPFETLLNARREAEESKRAHDAAIRNVATTPVVLDTEGPASQPNPAPSGMDNSNPTRRGAFIHVRAFVDAGPRSTVLCGEVLLGMGERHPGTGAFFVKIEDGLAVFELGGETFRIAPTTKQ